jgi:hypothetical protein
MPSHLVWAKINASKFLFPCADWECVVVVNGSPSDGKKWSVLSHMITANHEDLGSLHKSVRNVTSVKRFAVGEVVDQECPTLLRDQYYFRY